MSPSCIVIGTGPAALFMADQLSRKKAQVRIFEKRPAPGWKLLVAGSSGLNVSYDCPAENLHTFYPHRQKELEKCFKAFGRDQWLDYLKLLGEEPYLGKSKRYFIKSWKASTLLQNWIKRLQDQGVEFCYNESMSDFKRSTSDQIEVDFQSGRTEKADKLFLALGGASWESSEVLWPQIFLEKKIAVKAFLPSNAGYHIEAPEKFLQQAQGKPIKGVVLQTRLGKKQGDIMLTRYGFEGTPVYTVGCEGEAFLDLKPELTFEKLRQRLDEGKGSMQVRLKKQANLSEGALSLVEALSPPAFFESAESLAKALKAFRVLLTTPRPLSESISSKGGLSWDELDEDLQLKKFPGVYCAGEMIDWDAPTGGFLLQACISTAYVAAARSF